MIFIQITHNIPIISIDLQGERRELSGRVLDLRQRGRGFEPHRCHCVVSLSKTNPLSLLSTGSIQEDLSHGHK